MFDPLNCLRCSLMVLPQRLCLILLLGTLPSVCLAADGPKADGLKAGKVDQKPKEAPKEAKEPYSREIQPLFAKYCVQCHGGSKPKAHLALDAFKSEESILKTPEVLDKIQEKIRAREMPPKEKPQPTGDER